MVYRRVEWVDGERPGGGVLAFSESHWQHKTATYRTAEVIHLSINLNANGLYNTFLDSRKIFSIEE